MSTERLTFPTYLLPSFSFPFRRRHTSTSSSIAASVNTDPSASIPGLSYSPTSSCSNTPVASPISDSFLTHTRSSSSSADDNRNTPQPHALYTPISPQRTRTSRTLSPPHLTHPQPSTLRCLICSTHLAYTSQVVSKGFTGRHGRAYLVAPPPPSPVPVTPPFPPTAHDRSRNLANISVGRPVNRELLTGHHVVADVNCAVCNMLLGWKYVDAREAGQRYKIGKFILETKRVVTMPCYEDSDTVPHNMHFSNEKEDGKRGTSEGMMGMGQVDIETQEQGEGKGWVTFDSEDEDECEELFAGTWDAEVVQKRRIRRVDRRKRERERAASKDSGVGGL